MNRPNMLLILLIINITASLNGAATWIYKAGTALNAGVTFGIPAAYAKQLHSFDAQTTQGLATLSDALPPEVRAWCHEQTKACGINPQDITFKMGNFIANGVELEPILVHGSTVILSPERVVQPVQKMLTEGSSMRTGLDVLMKQKLGHVSYRDSLLKADLSVAVGTSLIHASSLYLRSKAVPKTIPAALASSGLLVAGGWLKGSLGENLYTRYSEDWCQPRATKFAISHTSSVQALRDAAGHFIDCPTHRDKALQKLRHDSFDAIRQGDYSAMLSAYKESVEAQIKGPSPITLLLMNSSITSAKNAKRFDAAADKLEEQQRVSKK